MRVVRFLQSAVLNVASIVGAIGVVAVLVALVVGARPAIVISGSMEPGIPVGAMTFHRMIPADEADVGTVVTLPRPDGSGLVTHRVVANEPADGAGRMLTLKGDANNDADPQPYQAVRVGEVLLSVPYLGTVALWMQHHVMVVVGLLVLILGFASLPFDRTARRRRPAPAVDDTQELPVVREHVEV
jgi:signal peptidase I